MRDPDVRQNQQGIDYLLSQGRIERVEPNQRAAERLLEQARLHIASARNLSETPDLALAFTAAYDGARKSLAAMLLIQGLRARGGEGGHAVLLDVVRPQFPDHRQALQRFDWLRTIRNNTEYPDIDTPPVTSRDVSDGIAAASDILKVAQAFAARGSAQPDSPSADGLASVTAVELGDADG